MAAITRLTGLGYAGALFAAGIPAAPTSFTATLVALDVADLAWTNGATYDSINLYESTNGGSSYSLVVSGISGSATSYTRGSLAGSTAYCWKITGVVGGVESAYSDYDCETTVGFCCSPFLVGDTPSAVSVAIAGGTGSPYTLTQWQVDPPTNCTWRALPALFSFFGGHADGFYFYTDSASGPRLLLQIDNANSSGTDVALYRSHSPFVIGSANTLYLDAVSGYTGLPDSITVTSAGSARSCDTSDQVGTPPSGLAAYSFPAGDKIYLSWTTGDASLTTDIEYLSDDDYALLSEHLAFNATHPFPVGTGMGTIANVAAGVSSAMISFTSGYRGETIYFRVRQYDDATGTTFYSAWTSTASATDLAPPADVDVPAYPDEYAGRRCCCTCENNTDPDNHLLCWNTACAWDFSLEGVDYHLTQYNNTPNAIYNDWGSFIWRQSLTPFTLFGCTVDVVYFGLIGDLDVLTGCRKIAVIFCDSSVPGTDAFVPLVEFQGTCWASNSIWCQRENTLEPTELSNACDTPTDDLVISPVGIKYCVCAFCSDENGTPKYIMLDFSGIADGGCGSCSGLNDTFICLPYDMGVAEGVCVYRYVFPSNHCWAAGDEIRVAITTAGLGVSISHDSLTAPAGVTWGNVGTPFGASCIGVATISYHSHNSSGLTGCIYSSSSVLVTTVGAVT